MSASFPARLRAFPEAWKLTGENSDPVAPLEAYGDDARLMLRVQAGDHEALSALFDRYSGIVFEIGRQVLRDTGEAEELVQEVFLNVYRKCRSFDPNKGTVRGWLRRVAYREAFDRKNYLNNRRFYDSDAVEGIIEQIKSVFDVEREADAHQLESLLRNAMDSLNEKQRATLELCLFEGYTLREVSELKQDSLVNTRHHYYRALERLRKALPFRALKRKARDV
jgi:RNA polymerase sigma-70 factor (ECF subfamily)